MGGNNGALVPEWAECFVWEGRGLRSCQLVSLHWKPLPSKLGLGWWGPQFFSSVVSSIEPHSPPLSQKRTLSHKWRLMEEGSSYLLVAFVWNLVLAAGSWEQDENFSYPASSRKLVLWLKRSLGGSLYYWWQHSGVEFLAKLGRGKERTGYWSRYHRLCPYQVLVHCLE